MLSYGFKHKENESGKQERWMERNPPAGQEGLRLEEKSGRER